MAGGFLISPRVRVFWGDVNLSSYNGDKNFPKNTPVVYDVQVDINGENEGPTGEMKWDPTGPGAALYEFFTTSKEYMSKQITIEYFYPGGKKIVFYFVWSGQSINYGNNMDITVKLQSELAGLVNANQRSTAQAHDEKKGVSPVEVLNKTQRQFGLDSHKNLVKINPYSLEYWKQAKLANFYGNDWTFGNAVGTIVKQTGDQGFANNIGGANIAVIPPYSWKNPKTGKEQEVYNGATDIAAGQAPDPEKRYGYILGPSIINTITRTANWKPPQQSNQGVPGTQAKARDPRTGRFISAAQATQNPPPAPQQAQANTSAAAARTSSPQGTSGNRSNLAVQNVDNPYGPDRQNALNDEKGSELSMDTLMCPVLVGVKPHDVLFIPSFSGKFIEDWIVKSVGYSQNNGQVNINIQATRTYATSSPMNKTALEKFKTFAEKQGLIGSNASLENWDKYAWTLPAAPLGTQSFSFTGNETFGTDSSVPDLPGLSGAGALG